jgi:hypothetical protein
VNWFNQAYELVGAPIKSVYQQYEHVAAPLFFVGGVTYDTLTITRIDRLLDNLILLGYLLVLGALIVLVGWLRRGHLRDTWVAEYDEAYPLILQFLLGGLFSAYAIYYFRSISFTVTSFFFVIIVALLVANEFLTNRLMNLKLLLGLYLFVCFSFLAYFVPVITGEMGPLVFYGSVVMSLLPVGLVVTLVFWGEFRESVGELCGIGAILVLLVVSFTVSYRMNWIPAVPLSMEYGGVYHNVERTGDTYKLRFVQQPWYDVWDHYEDPFYLREGDAVHCFVSVFAPAQLRTGVVQEWQIWLGGDEGWVTTDRIRYRIVGGRAGGYRGHSYKQNVRPGTWRVNVKTVHGRLLGRVPFEIVDAPKDRELTFVTRAIE